MNSRKALPRIRNNYFPYQKNKSSLEQHALSELQHINYSSNEKANVQAFPGE